MFKMVSKRKSTFKQRKKFADFLKENRTSRYLNKISLAFNHARNSLFNESRTRTFDFYDDMILREGLEKQDIENCEINRKLITYKQAQIVWEMINTSVYD
jgi:hypothetical protein